MGYTSKVIKFFRLILNWYAKLGYPIHLFIAKAITIFEGIILRNSMRKTD